MQVTDATNNTGTKALSITIAAAAQPLTITTTALPQASTTGIYSTTLQATGGTPTYNWSIVSGQLPAGLSLAVTTGVISGTPTAGGTYSFTVQVTDSGSSPESTTKPLSLTVVTGVALDQYGGRTDIKCTDATGWFHPEKINSHWWLCTPLGNAFYSLGVEEAPGTIHGTWDPESVNERLQSWGFNTVQIGAYGDDYPFISDSNFPIDSKGLHTNPVKMPFIVEVRAAYYAMTNPSYGGSPLLTNPVKNTMFSHSPFYTDYVPSGGAADYYDSGIGTWLQKDLISTSDIWVSMASSPYLNYAIGIASDDGDEMYGFGAGPDFATDPSGHNNYNLAMQVAGMSPVQTADTNVAGRGVSFVYGDTLIHEKKAWRDYVAGKYGTVSALNAAWGSNYTTFGSSGICVGSQPINCASTIAADSVGTGSGSMLTFSTTLSHATISRFSLQIFVAGTPVAGDLGNGNLYGPNVASGSINYSTGALSITFSSGDAPANGAAITAAYIANGWGIGSGLLDEDNRVSHQGWMGNDWVGLSNANVTTTADINAFFQQLAGQYFSTCRTQLKAVFPNLMYLGPDSLTTWGAPSSAPVMKAAGQYIDAFITSGGANQFTQSEMDFIALNYGDKPYFGSFYSVANPDSAMSAYPNNTGSGAFATQAARGQGYINAITAQLQTATTAGNYPYIGMIWFDYADLPSEKLNWGLTTPSDNAYDGHEAVTATVACSVPIQQYTCGGEAANYGDLITPVKAANALWLGPNP